MSSFGSFSTVPLKSNVIACGFGAPPNLYMLDTSFGAKPNTFVTIPKDTFVTKESLKEMRWDLSELHVTRKVLQSHMEEDSAKNTMYKACRKRVLKRLDDKIAHKNLEITAKQKKLDALERRDQH